MLQAYSTNVYTYQNISMPNPNLNLRSLSCDTKNFDVITFSPVFPFESDLFYAIVLWPRKTYYDSNK